MDAAAFTSKLAASRENAERRRDTAQRAANTMRVAGLTVQEFMRAELASDAVKEQLAKLTPQEAADKVLERVIEHLVALGVSYEKEATVCQGELRLLQAQLAELEAA